MARSTMRPPTGHIPLAGEGGGGADGRGEERALVPLTEINGPAPQSQLALCRASSFQPSGSMTKQA